jgi:tetratricopeptide (TPR) repeat protein
MDSAPDLARGLRNLGVALTLTGQFAQGYAHLAEAKAIYADLGDGSGLLFSTGWIGFARLHLGEYDQAGAYGREAVTLARKAEHHGMLANALLVLGSAALATDACAEARASLAECIALYSKLNQRTEWGTALATAAYAARTASDGDQARQLLTQALQVPTPEAFYPRAVALPVLALLLADQGKVERAVEAHILAAHVPYIAHSRWFHDVAGRELEALAASLPPETVAAAQQQGQALDLRLAAIELLSLLDA